MSGLGYGIIPDEVMGLPLHPLIVHAVVVGVPLTALGTLAIALRPRWRQSFGWAVVAAATICFALIPVTTQAGTNLKDQLKAGGAVAKRIQTHEDAAAYLIYAVGAMWVLGVLLMLAHRSGRRGRMTTVLAALSAVAALVAIAVVIRVGDTGARAVWAPNG